MRWLLFVAGLGLTLLMLVACDNFESGMRLVNPKDLRETRLDDGTRCAVLYGHFGWAVGLSCEWQR